MALDVKIKVAYNGNSFGKIEVRDAKTTVFKLKFTETKSKFYIERFAFYILPKEKRMKNLLKNVPALISVLRSRTFAVGLLSAVLALTVYTVSMKTYAVYIKDGDDVLLRFTMEDNAQDILEEHGIVTIAADVVDFSGFVGNTGEINITRAFPVTVTADGVTHDVMIAEGDVSEPLAAAGVEVDLDDEVSKDLSADIQEGDEIVVKRVEYTTSQQTVKVEYDTVVEKSSAYVSGVTKVVEEGQDGERLLTYRHKTVDGVEQEPELISDVVTVEPKSEVKVVGSLDAVSSLDFGYTLENGVPTSYSRVITNAKATGYSASAGASTASGRPAMVGHVAVDPDVIPYGTKLYIASADGSFVYGYAIAADTGTALMDGRVDVDLFYNTYYESCQNGVKWVNIYVLD